MLPDCYREAVGKHPTLVLYPFDELLALHGVDAVYDFARVFGSGDVYIPSYRGIFRDCVVAEIRARYNDGCKVRDLARDYEYNVRQIGRILAQTSVNAF
jgi:Mor family transcriptional regulator